MATFAAAIPDPIDPTPGPLAATKPFSFEIAAMVAEQANHLLGFAGLRQITRHQCVGRMESCTADADSLEGTIAPVRWRLSPGARYVFVALWVIAHQDTASGGTVAVQLEDETDSLIDGPVEWSVENGYLPVSPRPLIVGDGAGPWEVLVDRLGIEYEEAADLWWNNSGDTADTLIQVAWTLGVSDEPHLLDANSIGTGQIAQVRVDAEQVRVLAVAVWEGYQPLGNQ